MVTAIVDGIESEPSEIVFATPQDNDSDSQISSVLINGSTMLASQTASYQIGFTATSGLAVGDTITVVFPADFDVSGATKTQHTHFFTLQGVSGQTVTYSVESLGATGSGALLSPIVMHTDGIRNPLTAGNYNIQISTTNDPVQVSVPISIQ